MKKFRYIYILMIIFLLTFFFTGCGKKNIDKLNIEPVYEGPIGEGQFQAKDKIPPPMHEGGYVETAGQGVRIGLIPPPSPDSPLRIRFSEAIGSEGNKGPLTVLGFLSVKFQPEITGVFEWKSDKELWIREDKKSWDADKEYYIEISGSRDIFYYSDFQVGTFSLGAKTGVREVTFGKPSAVMILNGNTQLTGSRGAYILFDQPVTTANVEIDCVKSTGEKAGITLSQPAILPIDGGDVIDPSYVIFAGFKNRLNQGENIIIYAGSRDSGMAKESFSLSVAPDLTCESLQLESLMKNGEAARLESTFELDFSTPVNIDSLREHLVISPTPRSFYMYERWNSITLSLVFDVGTDYTISIEDNESKPFTDQLGQTLSKKIVYNFKSQDLEPYLEMPNKPLVLEAGQDRFPLKVRNPGKAKIKIQYFRSYLEYINALNGIMPSNYASVKNIETDLSSLDMNYIHSIDLGIDDKPGLKLVTVTTAGTGSEAPMQLRGSLLVQTTGMGLSVKIWDQKLLGWAVNLDSGKPQPKVTLRAVSLSGKVLASGTTGDDGIGILNVGAVSTSTGVSEKFYLAANQGNDYSIVDVNNEELSRAWQFNVPGEIKELRLLSSALFTERGAYRPGETVYFKIFARPDPEINLKKINFIIRDPLGQTAFNFTENLDNYYGASGSFNIKEGAAVGEYFLEASVGSSVNKTTFRVEEYRVPTFYVKVTSSNSDFTLGSPVSLTAKAAYFHGGLLDGRNLQWKVYRQPDAFTPKNFPGYTFGLSVDSALTGSVASGDDVLNKNSEFKFSYNPDHPDSAGLMKYIAEVSVTDIDRQTYAGRFSKSIHSTDLYVGIKPQFKVIYSENSVLKLPFIVVDTEGNVASGKKVEVQLNRIEYHTTAMQNDEGSTQVYNRRVLETKTLGFEKSQKAPDDLTIPLNEAGFWQVRLNVKDDKGRTASTEFVLTVTGGASSSWPRFDRERIELITDKSDYRIGDTAKIVAQTPYETATGLLTMEAGGVINTKIVEINKNTPAFEIKITPDFAPNVYASLILIRGRVHQLKDASGFETGAPGYKIGYAKLNIDPSENRLKINVDAGTGSTSPGDNATFSISAFDLDGKPVDACAAVMVVDEGVLSLTGYKTPDPVSLAYALRALSVRNTSNILDMPHSRRIRKESLFPGGDADEPGIMLDDGEALRKLFKSTVYWNPKLILGNDGTEKITIKMPDNLTAFRIMAVAADIKGRMGSGDSKLVSRKSLMVQPIVPRFVYPDDTFDLEALVTNSSGQQGEAVFSAEFKGLEILTKPELKAVLPNGKSHKFTYKVKVKESPVEIKMRAVLGNFKDAVEITLPVLSPGNKNTIVKTGLMKENEPVNIDLPENIIPGTLKFEAVISDTPLSQLKDSVMYLMDYPHGCIEQTTSTAYPLIVLQDLLPSLGIEVNRADLKKFAEAGVKRILSFVTPQGGLSFWPDGDEPHAFGTAFGLTVLIEGKKRGYDVPAETLEKIADYMEKVLREGEITKNMSHGYVADGDTRALYVMSLGRLGRPQPGYMETLWNNRDKLTVFGLSFLAVAIIESKTSTALLEPVLTEIKKSAKENELGLYFEGDNFGGWSMGSYVRTVSSALIAYSRASSDSEMTAKLLQSLLKRASNGLWHSTQENVFGIMSVYELVKSKRESSEKLKAGIEINGKSYSIKDMEAGSSEILRLTLPGSAIGNNPDKITAKLTGTGSIVYYATFRASFDEPISEKLKSPKSEGFTLKRIYETMDGKSLEGQAIPLGSLVRVRLLIKSAAVQHYVAIDDKLPAGLEALNMALETTQTVDQQGELSAEAVKTFPVISYQEIRDHRVAFYADEMSEGNYEFVYVAKASTPGNFLRLSCRAEAMYQTDFYGTSGIDRVNIK